MMRKDTIGVFLNDCAVPLSVGIHAHEQNKPQPVIVHVEAKAPLSRRYDEVKTSDMAAVIDYERLYHFITGDVPKLGHIPLLESVAERIISFCFEDRRIHSVRVRLEKPTAFASGVRVGIEMRRTRA